MMRIVGFEGPFPNESILAWGAAAIATDDVVRNSLSGQTMSIGELSDAQEASALTTIVGGVDMPDPYGTDPVVVVAIRRTSPLHTYFLADIGRLGGIVAHKHTKLVTHYVFKDRSALELYAREVADDICGHILRQRLEGPAALDVLSAALVLVPSHPHINALRIVLGQGSEWAANLARASLATDRDRRAFEELLAACRSGEQSLGLKYVEGIAAGGGLDVDMLAQQATALRTVHGRIRAMLIDDLPFVDAENDAPPFRVTALKAASASLSFGVNVPGRPMMERVTRYYELVFLQKMLRGAIPSTLLGDSEFRKALQTIVRPTPDTALFQTPLGSEDEEQVSLEEYMSGEVVAGDAVDLLGFAEGIVQQVSRLEIRLFPKVKEPVSTEDNGRGEMPVGADIFRNRNDFLFRPAVFSLRRWANAEGRYKFYLEAVKLLRPGEPARLTALPSTVVSGGFLTNVEASVSLEPDGRIMFERTNCGTVGQPINVDTATMWMDAYSKQADALEFTWAKEPRGEWIPPTRPKSASAVLRILMVLDQRGGRARVADIIADINAAHTTSVRRNNTRREVIWNPDLLTFDEDDDQIISMTEKGRLFLQISRWAGVTK